MKSIDMMKINNIIEVKWILIMRFMEERFFLTILPANLQSSGPEIFIQDFHSLSLWNLCDFVNNFAHSFPFLAIYVKLRDICWSSLAIEPLSY